MSKRFIIAIGREFGSGGKHIGRALAKELGVKLYDRNIVEKIAEELDVDAEHLKAHDHKKRHFFHRAVKGHTTSFEDHVANLQFDYIRRLGASDESFVIVGRCAEEILKGYEGVISIFVKADREQKIKNVMENFELDRASAVEKMDRHDRVRKHYHDRYCEGKWGEVDTYDLCIDSTHFGIEGTADFIKEYVKTIGSKMNLDIKLEVRESDDIFSVTMVSNNNPILIGKDGRTINSLQLLMRQSLQNQTGMAIKVNLDASNYKAKKVKKFEFEIKNIVREVQKTKTDAKLDPMNSYQRRFVHTIVSENKNLETESFGENPNRYVVIKPKEES